MKLMFVDTCSSYLCRNGVDKFWQGSANNNVGYNNEDTDEDDDFKR